MSKVAFITGAASGIGLATAKLLYQQGWQLGLADINLQQLESHQWDKYRVQCYQLDVTDAEAYQSVMESYMIVTQGKLNLLLNNAGILTISPFSELPLSQHQMTVAINVQGVINGCHIAYPYLKDTPSAKVINLSSASAIYGIPELSSYSATKSAVRSLTQSLNLEWQQDGIQVCDVSPPFVATAMLDTQQNTAKVLEKLGVDLNAEDVAKAIVKQVHGKRVHYPVSFSFSLLYWASEVMPSFITRLLIKFLSH